jgi:hypothetical protein
MVALTRRGLTYLLTILLLTFCPLARMEISVISQLLEEARQVFKG